MGVGFLYNEYPLVLTDLFSVRLSDGRILRVFFGTRIVEVLVVRNTRIMIREGP